MKNILFISWDSGKTNYLESLFFPIFKEIQKKGFKIQVAQFSWASKSEVKRIRNLAEFNGIGYFHFRVTRFPNELFGILWTLIRTRPRLKSLISEERINVLMPRSTMPAIIVNRLYSWLESKDIKLIFDFDGFPLQERIDFSGWDPDTYLFRFLKAQENLMLFRSNVVLTRSKRAIKYLSQRNSFVGKTKFFNVRNGRDPSLFKIDEVVRKRLRAKLNYSENEVVLVYTGSMGPAYAWNQILKIFTYFLSQNEPVKLLVLTRDECFLDGKMPEELKKFVTITFVEFSQVPDYLNAGDLGISLRLPAPSVSALFPIKLGEYLLTGLPVLASNQVGDSISWIKERKELIGVDLNDPCYPELTYHMWKKLGVINRIELRNWALQNFSLDCAIDDYLIALNSIEN